MCRGYKNQAARARWGLARQELPSRHLAAVSARPHLLELKLARLAVVGRHLPLVPLGVHHLIAPQLAQLRGELGLARLLRVRAGVGEGVGVGWGWGGGGACCAVRVAPSTSRCLSSEYLSGLPRGDN